MMGAYTFPADSPAWIETDDEPLTATDAERYFFGLPPVPPDDETSTGIASVQFLLTHGTRYRGIWSDRQLTALQTAIGQLQRMRFCYQVEIATSAGGCPIVTTGLYERLADVDREIGRLVRSRDAWQAQQDAASLPVPPLPVRTPSGGPSGGQHARLIPRLPVTPPGGGYAYAEPADVDPVRF